VLPPVESAWTVELDGPIVIGRRAPADVVVKDALVSRQHCRVAPDGDGWLVEDLGSANGTYVDGTRVEGPTPLEHGTRIELGFWGVVFER
jgi:pSer/pThr/pTyr-binding forkhead associated (FHA) protein